MHLLPRILINHISYSNSNQQQLFKELSLQFHLNKTAIVGRNGIGKSTLIKLIIGELIPDFGSVDLLGSVAYCSQQVTFDQSKTISDFFGISEKLYAFERIMQGSIAEKDFLLLNDDWLFQERVRQHLATFGLSHFSLKTIIDILSGGEKTRLLLAKTFSVTADFWILDEPTNHLDAMAKTALYRTIAQIKGGVLIVSHDRELLNLMDQILELTSLGVNYYSGNYDYYLEQKLLRNVALEHQLEEAKKTCKRTRTSIQQNYEKHTEKQSQGRSLFRAGKIDKLSAKAKRGRSERTQSRQSKQNEAVTKAVEEKLQIAKSKIEIFEEINIKLPETCVPSGKVVLDIEDLSFGYDNNYPPLINNYSLKILGPERIAIIGKNGCGKTTLVKLILKKLLPWSGNIYYGIKNISYLDQNLHFLKPDRSVLENFLQLNLDVNETEARFHLSRFLFRNAHALRQIADISHGEKLRAALACVLGGKNSPQLLILDEPTNHLDLDSLNSMESALKNYHGAMIVISHDQKFIENIQVKRTIPAPFNACSKLQVLPK